MQGSTNRILTTHCGSLARPADLLDLMKAKVNGERYDHEAYARRVRSAVTETIYKTALAVNCKDIASSYASGTRPPLLSSSAPQ